MTTQADSPEQFESRLLPILREAVDVVKMILFVKLKAQLAEDYPELDQAALPKLAGAVLNELFGTPNPEPAFATFRQDNIALIEATLKSLPESLPDMIIPVSDALRVTVICDHQEAGLDTTAVLARARELAILDLDRDLPLPHSFLDLVRRMGKAYNLVLPPVAE